MPAPDDLTPQQPGTVAVADAAPTVLGPVDTMQALLEHGVRDITAAIPTLSRDQLEALAVHERSGQRRRTVLKAVETALKHVAGDATPAPVSKPASARRGRPYLTEAGWVVPQPEPGQER